MSEYIMDTGEFELDDEGCDVILNYADEYSKQIKIKLASGQELCIAITSYGNDIPMVGVCIN